MKFWVRAIFWSLLIALVISFDVETKFWLLIGWLAFGAALSFFVRLVMWRFFKAGAEGRLKVTIVPSDEE